MAIDTMIYQLTLPAGTYNAGQRYAFGIVDGPSVVRDGYGAAILKRVLTISDSVPVNGIVEVKNQNWIDSMANQVTAASGNGIFTVLDESSPCWQRGGDLELQPNSAFDVALIPNVAVTTTTDTDIFVQIEIDYPLVNAIADPNHEQGAPMTITKRQAVNSLAFGTPLVWQTVNVDDFKAGYRYLLAEVGGFMDSGSGGNAYFGFIKISGASGQNGLSTVIPICPRLTGTQRTKLLYATPLVKGPMQISYAVFAPTAVADVINAEFDYIRR